MSDDELFFTVMECTLIRVLGSKVAGFACKSPAKNRYKNMITKNSNLFTAKPETCILIPVKSSKTSGS